MKTFRNLIIIIFAFIAISSCKEDKFTTYTSNSSIFFAKTYLNEKYYYSDSISFTFAIYTETEANKEHIVEVPVVIVGFVSDHDREFKCVIDPEKTTAIEGVHYKPIEKQYIRAGQERSNIYVTALRDVSLKDEIYKICFKLVPNDNFKTDYTNTIKIENSDTTYQDRLTCTVHLSDKFTKPPFWMDFISSYFLGEYSVRKIDLMCELFFLNRLELYEYQPSIASISNWAAFLKVWLQQWKDDHNGEPYRDENGKEMTVTIAG